MASLSEIAAIERAAARALEDAEARKRLEQARDAGFNIPTGTAAEKARAAMLMKNPNQLAMEMQRQRAASAQSWSALPAVDMEQRKLAADAYNKLKEQERDPRYQLSARDGLLQEGSTKQVPYANLTQTATNAGRDYADQQKQFGLFGNLVNSMFDSPVAAQITDRLMEVFARPEFIESRFGQTPFTAFSRAAYGLTQSEAAAAQQEALLKNKLAIEQVKAGAKAEERRKIFSPEQIARDADIVQKSGQSIKNIQEMLQILRGPGIDVGGAFGTAAVGIRNIIATVADVDPTNRQEFQKKRAEILRSLNASRVFGAQVSQADYDVIEKLVIDPGIFTTNKQLRANLKDILNRYVTDYQASQQRLRIEFGDEPVQSLYSPRQKGMQLNRQTVTKPE
jgi:DNA-binding transcriptional MerR regulator